MHCAGDEFYNKKLENLVDAETGVVTTINVFECQFCHTTGTKRMAHLCQITGHAHWATRPGGDSLKFIF